MPHPFLITCRTFLWAFLLAVSSLFADAQTREYQIKAAFLANFLQFVAWPEDAITNQNAPFRIGVFGEDRFGPALEAIVDGEVVNHHKIIVKRCQGVGDCAHCQMVFVCREEDDKLTAILAQLGSRPVLTVGESRGFARRGGIINFYLQGPKLRFEINPSAAQRCKLKMSAQLLSLGKIVEPDGGKK